METDKCSGRPSLHEKIHNPRSSLRLRKVVMCRIENGEKTMNSMAPMFAWQPICNTILGAHALRLNKILENVSPLLKLFFM
jgi:hypothetical protein